VRGKDERDTFYWGLTTDMLSRQTRETEGCGGDQDVARPCHVDKRLPKRRRTECVQPCTPSGREDAVSWPNADRVSEEAAPARSCTSTAQRSCTSTGQRSCTSTVQKKETSAPAWPGACASNNNNNPDNNNKQDEDSFWLEAASLLSASSCPIGEQTESGAYSVTDVQSALPIQREHRPQVSTGRGDASAQVHAMTTPDNKHAFDAGKRLPKSSHLGDESTTDGSRGRSDRVRPPPLLGTSGVHAMPMRVIVDDGGVVEQTARLNKRKHAAARGFSSNESLDRRQAMDSGGGGGARQQQQQRSENARQGHETPHKDIRCKCQEGKQAATTAIVGREGPNQGRRYYKCCRFKCSDGCNFWLWHDEHGTVSQGASSHRHALAPDRRAIMPHDAYYGTGGRTAEMVVIVPSTLSSDGAGRSGALQPVAAGEQNHAPSQHSSTFPCNVGDSSDNTLERPSRSVGGPARTCSEGCSLSGNRDARETDPSTAEAGPAPTETSTDVASTPTETSTDVASTPTETSTDGTSTDGTSTDGTSTETSTPTETSTDGASTDGSAPPEISAAYMVHVTNRWRGLTQAVSTDPRSEADSIGAQRRIPLVDMDTPLGEAAKRACHPVIAATSALTALLAHMLAIDGWRVVVQPAAVVHCMNVHLAVSRGTYDETTYWVRVEPSRPADPRRDWDASAPLLRDAIWVQLTGPSPDRPGWLTGTHVDLVAFESPDGFLMIDRRRLWAYVDRFVIAPRSHDPPQPDVTLPSQADHAPLDMGALGLSANERRVLLSPHALLQHDQVHPERRVVMDFLPFRHDIAHPYLSRIGRSCLSCLPCAAPKHASSPLTTGDHPNDERCAKGLVAGDNTADSNPSSVDEHDLYDTHTHPSQVRKRHNPYQWTCDAV